MRVGFTSPRAHLLLLVAAAALGVAPTLAAGCGNSATQAAGSTTGTGGSVLKSMDTGGSATHATTGTGGQAATASSSSTGGAGGDAGMATGGGGTGGGSLADAGDDAGPVTVVLNPGEAPLPGESVCQVVEVTNIPEPDFVHITPCTPITYPSPPSGGDHWPIWGAFAIYTEPLPREMYVHDLEHGAIVLTYKCAGSCPDVVAALTQVFNSMADPLCLTLGGPPARMVLTPDPLLDTPIAASAWGNTYTATCIDVPSLQAFANAHYGQGREPLCNDGQNNQTDPLCPDGGS